MLVDITTTLNDSIGSNCFKFKFPAERRQLSKIVFYVSTYAFIFHFFLKKNSMKQNTVIKVFPFSITIAILLVT